MPGVAAPSIPFVSGCSLLGDSEATIAVAEMEFAGGSGAGDPAAATSATDGFKQPANAAPMKSL